MLRILFQLKDGFSIGCSVVVLENERSLRLSQLEEVLVMLTLPKTISQT